MEGETSVKLAELGERVQSNTRRIEGLEHGQKTLSRLATAVEVLAAKQDGIGANVEKLGEKMDVLESRPARRWESILDRLIVAALSVLAGWLLARLGGSA
jgi:hypothetical protein